MVPIHLPPSRKPRIQAGLYEIFVIGLYIAFILKWMFDGHGI